MKRLPLLLLFALSLSPIFAQTPATPAAMPAATPAATPKPTSDATPAPVEPPLDWHDVKPFGLEGRAFEDAERLRWFDRLPAAAQGKVTTKVWDLSRHSAGMMVRFKTDSTVIWANYKLLSERMASPNMTAIGGSGLDLYARATSRANGAGLA
jgi:hypothetical protein